MDFDFAGIDTKTLSESGVDMPVNRLDGSPLLDRNGERVTLRVLGPDSEKYRALSRAQVRRRLTRMADAGGKPDEATLEESEADALELLAACTVGWRGVYAPGGSEPIPFSAEAVRALYQRYPVIAEQVDRYIGTRANFLLASSTS